MPKYHCGSGGDLRKGYINIDKYNYRADVVADVVSYPYLPADSIMSRHMFEHFGLVDSYYLLIVWTLAIKQGGTLVIAVPDVRSTAAAGRDSIPATFRAMRCLYGSNEGSWAFHKTGWTPEAMLHVYHAFGYADCEVKLSGGMDPEFPNYEFEVTGTKKIEMSQDQLMRKAIDLIGLYFHPSETILHRKLAMELEAKF